MHVSIIVPKGDKVVSSIVGAFKVFNAVNGYLAQANPEATPLFEIDLVGISEEETAYNDLFVIRTTKNIADIKNTDLIIVTTINGDIPKSLEENHAFVDWMVKMRENNNCEIASLCMGAFLFAQTGLLSGRPAATHWLGADAFRLMFPDVKLMPEKVITEDDGLYTSGGAYSFLNLLLYLVEKYAGKEVAIWASKLFEIDFIRDSQSQFIMFSGQKVHQDDAIKIAQQYIESHLNEKITVEELAGNAALSRRNFVRRFKKATSNTPLEYIQRVKIEAAKKSLETSVHNINEVMYAVGYSDTKAFRNTFRKITGLTPSEYKVRYNRFTA
jgi:transcriptional regulator GlxA family with amidase domain